MSLAINCDCFNPSSGLYSTSFCSTQRLNAPPNVTPPQCVSVSPNINVPSSLAPSSGGISGFSLTDPVANSAVSRQRGRGFASVASGFLGGLQSVFGGGQQTQQQFQPTAPTMPIGGTPPQATSEQPKGWIPFAVIGGIAVVGVLAYVAIKRRK